MAWASVFSCNVLPMTKHPLALYFLLGILQTFCLNVFAVSAKKLNGQYAQAFIFGFTARDLKATSNVLMRPSGME